MPEQARHAGARVIAAEFAIDRDYVHGDAFTFRPGGVPVQGDIASGLWSWHASFVALTRLCIDVFEVVFDSGNSLLAGDGAVAGDDGLHVQREDEVAGPNPVAGGPGPHDRVTANEEDIAGEDDPVSGDMDQCVTERVGRADF